jgi:hypothetical protein
MFFVDAEGLGFFGERAALRLYGYTRDVSQAHLDESQAERRRGRIRAAFRAAGDEDKRGTISQCRKDGSIFGVRYFCACSRSGRRGALPCSKT